MRKYARLDLRDHGYIDSLKFTHNIPPRPTLSMVDSAQHHLAKWLADILVSILQLYFKYFISDLFWGDSE